MVRDTITALVITMLILGVYTLSEYDYGLAIIFGAIGTFTMLFLIIRELIISSR